MKTCTKCRVPKPLSGFHTHARSLDGLNSYCKECAREANRAFRARNPGYEQQRADYTMSANLRRRYGVTLQQALDLAERQEYACACCGRSLLSRKLHVDHCHDTGKVRGLLCNTCNAGIGMLGDTLAGVLSAVRYLQRCDDAVR